MCRKRPERLLPEEIAAVLYTLSVLAARTKCKRQMSKLDDHALRDAVEWALQQPWVDDSTRELLREGYQALGCGEPDSDA